MSERVGALVHYYAREGLHRQVVTVCSEFLKKRPNDTALVFYRAALGLLPEGNNAEVGNSVGRCFGHGVCVRRCAWRGHASLRMNCPAGCACRACPPPCMAPRMPACTRRRRPPFRPQPPGKHT
eukprot:366074-Chlamydomonas_euryale.AAC.5